MERITTNKNETRLHNINTNKHTQRRTRRNKKEVRKRRKKKNKENKMKQEKEVKKPCENCIFKKIINGEIARKCYAGEQSYEQKSNCRYFNSQSNKEEDEGEE